MESLKFYHTFVVNKRIDVDYRQLLNCKAKIEGVMSVAARELTPLGVEVKKRLVEMGKTQVWLANEIGASRKYLGLILYGYRSGEMYVPRIKRILDLD